MRRWADVKMRRCEDKKMWRWADVKMSRCEDEKMWRWEDWRCEDEKVWRWADVKMRRCERCEDEQMWRWEDVREGVKMRRWDTDPHYWKNPALRRSREKKNYIKMWQNVDVTNTNDYLISFNGIWWEYHEIYKLLDPSTWGFTANYKWVTTPIT